MREAAEGQNGNWLKRCLIAIWHCLIAIWRNEVYNSKFTAHAEGIKAALQILIGVAFASFLVWQVFNNLGEASLKSSADHALKVVGAALAVSAVVELVYTFFTKGPDEALDPLILGISSFALFKLSAHTARLNAATTLSVSLLALAIVALFFARRFLCPVNEVPQKDDQVTQPAQSTASASGTGWPGG